MDDVLDTKDLDIEIARLQGEAYNLLQQLGNRGISMGGRLFWGTALPPGENIRLLNDGIADMQSILNKKGI